MSGEKNNEEESESFLMEIQGSHKVVTQVIFDFAKLYPETNIESYELIKTKDDFLCTIMAQSRTEHVENTIENMDRDEEESEYFSIGIWGSSYELVIRVILDFAKFYRTINLVDYKLTETENEIASHGISCEFFYHYR